MSCEQARTYIDAYVDHELNATAALEIERHLNECPECRTVYQTYGRVRGSVKTKLPYFQAPKHLSQRVRGRLEREQHASVRGNWFDAKHSWALAAGVLILLGLGFLLVRNALSRDGAQLLAEEAVASHIRSLMANHLVDVISSDQHTVKPWFNGKLDFAPVVEDLSSRGFPLVGGRLDYLNERPVAALVYKRRQHSINLFIWPSAKAGSRVEIVTIRGYHVAHGVQSQMAYWAVSDLNSNELTKFLEDVESSAR
jgi:anti-sigma factor (TIGR02949 family)